MSRPLDELGAFGTIGTILVRLPWDKCDVKTNLRAQNTNIYCEVYFFLNGYRS